MATVHIYRGKLTRIKVSRLQSYAHALRHATPDEASDCVVPADLDDDATRTVRAMAEALFDVLGLSGLARIDFFYDTTTKRFLFNEANTMPGFTSISGFPKMWLASGMTYPELCSQLVDAAFGRHAERAKLADR